MRSNLYLFKYLLASNVLLYMETGAVPVMLQALSASFGLTYAEQGILGGIVYLSLGIGGPLAGCALRRFHHKYVLLVALYSNLLLTLCWALTPTHYGTFSTLLFIVLRALMGLFQSVICVFLPLWTNENAPKRQRASYMSFLQASVPVGVMLGYILSTLILSLSHGEPLYYHMLAWRWPFLIQTLLLTPLYISLYFVPDQDLAILMRVKQINLLASNVKDGQYGSLETGEQNLRPETSIEVGSPSEPPGFEILDRQYMEERELSEKKKLINLRRHAINASIFDPLSTRNVIKRSSDDLALLGRSDDLFTMLSGFQWSNQRHHQRTQQKRLLVNEFNKRVEELDLLPLDGTEEVKYDSSHDEWDDNGNSDQGVSRSRARTWSDDFVPTESLACEDLLPAESTSSRPTSMRSSLLHSSRRGSKRDMKWKELPEDATGAMVGGAALQYESLRDVRRRSVLEDINNTAPRTVQRQRSYSASSSSNNSPLPDFYSHVADKVEDKEYTPLLKDGIEEEVLFVEDDFHINRLVTGDDAVSPLPTVELDQLSATSSESDSSGMSGSEDSAEEERLRRNASIATSKAGDDIESILSLSTTAHPLTASTKTKKKKRSNKSVCGSIWVLLRIGVYRNLLGAMAALYFTVTGIQYWGIKYFSLVLDAPLPLLNALFILCAATGPTLGICCGGYLTDSYGGYKGKRQRITALRICMLLATLAVLFTLPITLLNDLYQVMACLWMVLFCGGGMLPACSGIVVSVVPRRFRAISASLSMTVFNLCGYCLSLFASGVMMQLLHEHNAYCNTSCAMTWGFRLILSACFVSLAFLFAALLSATRNLRRQEERESNFLKRRNKVFHSPIIISTHSQEDADRR